MRLTGRYHKLYQQALQVSARLLQNPAKVRKLIQRAVEKTETLGKGSAAMEKQVPFWKARIRLIGRMIRAYVDGRYKPESYKLLIRALAALVYFLWLFDLIPDVIPVLGYVDDATVLAWLLSAVNEELNHFQAWEEQQDPENT